MEIYKIKVRELDKEVLKRISSKLSPSIGKFLRDFTHIVYESQKDYPSETFDLTASSFAHILAELAGKENGVAMCIKIADKLISSTASELTTQSYKKIMRNKLSEDNHGNSTIST